ncbi:hypothetical protein RhiirC2_791116 [Rhizophagus irregularis]|uniref:Reverse transcriptase domain-containing protein n=1 Tax=Rhizophagus irregularis TaxID=588596 RepID=A0A2N1MJY9_9GLOM|nr:hypothetical protein RhiirC2_791116 [Rhizophagus irregularis]
MDISKVYDSSYCKQRSYDVRDGLDQGEIWSPILWRIFYDVSLTRLELVRNEVCYRIEVRYKDDVRSIQEFTLYWKSFLISGNYRNWTKKVTIAKYENEILHRALLNDIFDYEENSKQKHQDKKILELLHSIILGRDQVMKQCGRDKRAIGHSRSYKENDDKTNKNSKKYRKSKSKKLLELEKQILDLDIDDFNNSSNWKNNSTSKMSSIEANSKDAQSDNKIETMEQQIKNINLKDENEIHNILNLHSEEQDELEIPDSI